MNWLARLKNQNALDPHPTKPTKPGSVGFVARSPSHIQKFEGAAPSAANDTTPDPDRWCWPHSSAMNTAEIDRMVSRVELFVAQGLNLIDATALADTLALRDRDSDDRRLCLECSGLSGGAGRRCSTWRRAGLAGPNVPVGWVDLSQRCPAFAAKSEKAATRALIPSPPLERNPK